MFKRHFSDFGGHMRFFEKGDLKYVILDLLKDKPSHGYEIIRALEEHFQGFYSPSAGSVYPTLQLLEDLGYVKSLEQDGKKIYTITDEGKRFLEEHKETTNRIKTHMHGWCGTGERMEFMGNMREFHDMVRNIGRKAQRMDREKLNKIKEIITKACHDIETVVEESKQS
jgi:DNA-binding PadR family transcriptional regulator